MKKIGIVMISMMLMFSVTACGDPADGDGTDMQWDPKVSEETVNLAELPEDCELVPFEQFKEGFSFVSGTNWEEPPATLEEVEQAFGTAGRYYAGSDVTEDGVTYKTYAWFSDADWLDSKVSVAVSFKVDEETDKLVYYSYVSQGITYEDVP